MTDYAGKVVGSEKVLTHKKHPLMGGDAFLCCLETILFTLFWQ